MTATAGAMPAQSKDGPAVERIQIVATQRWASRVEEWRRKQPRIPNRSEAIRMMVDAFLDLEEAKDAGPKQETGKDGQTAKSRP